MTRTHQLAPVDTWPYVSLIVLVLPWTWRLVPRLYHDDDGLWGWLAYGSLEWLMVKVDWGCNRGIFTEKCDD